MRELHDPKNYSVYSAERCGLGAIFLLNLFDRLKCGICGPNPIPSRPLKTAVQVIDPGYCIDAPEAMPAGGMGNFTLQDMDEGLPEQLLADRD